MPDRIPSALSAARRQLARSVAGAPGVVGVGIEADAKGGLVLVVLVEGSATETSAGLPSEVQGVPVVVRPSSRARKR